MGRIAGKEIGRPYSPAWHCRAVLITGMFCSACMFLLASELRAQCTARDVLQNQLRFGKTESTAAPQSLITSAADVPVWKTITIGTFPDSFALTGALEAEGCSIAGLAEEIFARPAFTVSSAQTNVELFAVTAAELGFETDTVTLDAIYARARQLGFGLAAAEIAPQLRLQYLDQPMGEFLIIGMQPIKTWRGDPIILTVANGGAGLILLDQDGGADARVSVTSRFLFMRSNEAVPANTLNEATLFPN
jgi:hypothetical protein